MKKALALLLVLLIVSALFAGCTKNEPTTSASPAPAAAAPANSGSSNESEATPEPAEAPYEFRLPLVETPTTLTAWRVWSADGLFIEDPSQIECNAWLEEQTGVHIEWESASGATMQEQFGLMIASNDYRDMIMANASDYVGGVDKAIADEVYVDVSPYLDIMPNFEAARHLDDSIMKETTTDGGNIFVPSIATSDLFVWNGPMYYKTWADELGFASIDTYDELHDYLVAVRDQKGVEGGLVVDIASEKNYYSLCSGFDTTYGFYQENGQVKFGPQNDGFRTMLETLAQWYSEKLINTDNIATLDMGAPINLYGQEKLAYLCNSYYAYANMMPMFTGIPGEFLPVRYPAQAKGVTNRLRMVLSRTQPEYSAFITTAAVSRGVDDLCAKWIDARYSKECYLTIDLGMEGRDWVYGPDGEPQYTEYYVQKEAEQQKYGFEVADRLVASLDYSDRDLILNEAKGTGWLIEACDVYSSSSDGSWNLPKITLTNEEATEYSRYYTDIDTYVQEFALSIIVGNAKMDDAVWSTFQSKLSSMGIDRCIADQQAALDRYIAR